ncbi:GMC family oxidoreductase [Candidatus Pelagibacter sp.]|nr:GMC family oxidoreductase [Candidatus Pelagibacter sp.]
MAYTANTLQINRIGTLIMDEQLYNFSEQLPLDLRGGQYHYGTTRMAATPNNGVVDINLKVFGTKNLFVCGSSIFPTNGWVNPTFTIVAFSLHLADYISKKINK